MKEPFRRSGDTIRVTIGPLERAALAALPDLIARAGDADGRLDYRAHPGDDQREAEYRDLIGAGLDDLRADDRRRFTVGLGADRLDVEQAEAWLRVIGEARLVLAAGLGVEHDGWEEEANPGESPEWALLSYLGYLQDRLVSVL